MAVNPDAVVVGSGPNGLAAALTLAEAGLSVEVYEGADTPGGGCRTAELTLPGFTHDICSTVHALLAASPFFERTALAGVKLRHARVALAHPLDGGRAGALVRSVEDTADSLGADRERYRRVLGPLVDRARDIVPAVLGPLLVVPRHPLSLAQFGVRGLLPAAALGRLFRTEEARALIAGLGAHSIQPLNAPGTAGIALLLNILAHTVGWPVVEGGSARIIDAMLARLTAAGGTLQTGRPITDLDELPRARVTLLDVTPRQLIQIAGQRLSPREQRALERFHYGPGICKVDWALDGPVPWAAQACRETATIHLGGTLEEVALSESEVGAGRHPERPYCIAVQAGLVDPNRAPAGQQTFYAYCHVPAGSTVDMTDRIEAQVERFAPGFRELILARVTQTALETERYDPNYVGGDINSGAATLRQSIFRPSPSLHPYRTPLAGVYLCSSSTPPGGGVHGMCGEHAARAALGDLADAGLRTGGGAG
jgi:phytoene dehydrogenase-like protein